MVTNFMLTKILVLNPNLEENQVQQEKAFFSKRGQKFTFYKGETLFLLIR